MRIAFLIRSLGVGGAQRQLTALATALAARGHRVLVLSYYGGAPRSGESAPAALQAVSLGKRSRWNLPGPLFRLARSIRAFRPDVIHGYMPDGNLLALLTGKLIYRAAVVWGVRASAYDFPRYDWLFGLLFRSSCRASHWADLIIANSEAGRSYHLAAGYPGDRTVVIPNGIDTGRFRPDPARRQRQRQAWSIEDDQPLIGIVGRLDPMKDHATFLRAAALLAAQRPAVRFVCIGDGPTRYRRQLEVLSGELGLSGRLRWVSAADDLLAAYNAMDLLTSVSISGEGFPNVIGEAMACGIRCVVTPAGDSARIVGSTGMTVPMEDPRRLAEGWLATLARSPDPDSPSPRSRIEEHFSVERLVTTTERWLDAALNPSRPVTA